MHRHLAALVVVALLVSASPLLAQQAQTSAPKPTAKAPAEQTAAPAAPSQPYQDIIKLWKANLSEEFISHHIETAGIVYDLGADQIIDLRNAGVPESLINMMLATANAKMAAPAAKATQVAMTLQPEAETLAAPAAAQAPAPAVTAAPEEVRQKWEGLVRRRKGFTLKSRWRVGVLEFKEETITWVDAKKSEDNVLVPIAQVSEQFMTCLKKPGGNECFEWGFKTKNETYRFRDVSWEQGENDKVLELTEFFSEHYPELITSTEPVDERD